MKKSLLLIAVLGVFLVAVGTGCFSKKNFTKDGSSARMTKTDTLQVTDAKVFNITGVNYSFNPTEIKVKKGDKVRINFTSSNGYHDWTVDKFNARTKKVFKGKSSSVEFVASEAGIYEYYCSVGNHKEKGMVGKLIVEDTVMKVTTTITKEEATTSIKKDTAIRKEEKTETPTEFTGTILGGSIRTKIYDFNKSDYDKALKSDKLIVLYFYANWCPICKKEFTVMQSEFANMTHDNVIAFRVNFNDSDTDSNEKSLAKQYGVAYQHTKVLVKNNKQVLKSPSSWDGSKYASEINKYK